MRWNMKRMVKKNLSKTCHLKRMKMKSKIKMNITMTVMVMMKITWIKTNSMTDPKIPNKTNKAKSKSNNPNPKINIDQSTISSTSSKNKTTTYPNQSMSSKNNLKTFRLSNYNILISLYQNKKTNKSKKSFMTFFTEENKNKNKNNPFTNNEQNHLYPLIY